ncbi:urea ABC transporter permease subunit UrtB [Tistrella mobilis]|uniref:urea ABC transporter permease subunit UrtB n=1 Tax=Tistrella mobilis TaxID=171437 RepID=UPI003556BD06
MPGQAISPRRPAGGPATLLRALALAAVLLILPFATGPSTFSPAGMAVAQTADDAPTAEEDAQLRAALATEGSGFDGALALIRALAATGDARAARAIDALQSGSLGRRSDGSLVILEGRTSDASMRDPVSGEDLGKAEAGQVDRIRVNNRVRVEARAAMGLIDLRAKRPERRIAAAEGLVKTPDAAALPLLTQAIETETNGRAREALTKALAAVQAFYAENPEERLQAIETLGDYADPQVRSLLGRIADGTPEGLPPDAAQAVKGAAVDALAAVEAKLEMWALVGNVYQGLSLGSVLVLAATGLAITFGVMGVINMAHGEMVMLGAYTTFLVQQGIAAAAPALMPVSLLIALPVAFLVSGAAGFAIERSVIRWLYGRPLETLLATWGLSLIIQQAVRSVFGPTNREVSSPDWMSGAFEIAGGITLTYNRLWILAFSLVVVAGVALLLRKTSLGLHVRAVTQNRAMASSMGIRTGRIDALTFALGSGIAGIAGVALSQIDNVSPNLGQGYIIDSFMVVVFGGVGTLWGTLIGGFALGVVNKLLEPFAGAVLAKILVLIAIILFIQKRPRGLFALKGRAVEA